MPRYCVLAVARVVVLHQLCVLTRPCVFGKQGNVKTLQASVTRSQNVLAVSQQHLSVLNEQLTVTRDAESAAARRADELERVVQDRATAFAEVSAKVDVAMVQAAVTETEHRRVAHELRETSLQREAAKSTAQAKLEKSQAMCQQLEEALVRKVVRCCVADSNVRTTHAPHRVICHSEPPLCL